MGEFGAVSVVSGHIRGLTNTIPLQDGNSLQRVQHRGRFTLASLLAGLALVTLGFKTVFERRGGGCAAMSHEFTADGSRSSRRSCSVCPEPSGHHRKSRSHGLTKASGPRLSSTPSISTSRPASCLALLRAVGSAEQDDAPAPASGPRHRVAGAMRLRRRGRRASSRCRERRVGFIFQSYALFRHMTVFDNIAYGLAVRPRRAGPRGRRWRERVDGAART